MKCANEIAETVARLLDSSDAAIFLGDHGPDSQGQFFVQGTSWSDSMKRERFGAFFAAKIPICDMDGIESLVNVGRRILTCLGSADLPDLPTRIFEIHKAAGETTIHQVELPSA